jgi:hypothetical protein
MLIGLLRRNAKERMPFDVFFNHSFLQRNPPTPQSAAADLPSPFTQQQQPSANKPSNVVVNVPPVTLTHHQQVATNNNNNNVKNGELSHSKTC